MSAPVATPAAPDALPQLLTIHDVCEATKLSPGGLYKLIARGEFPRPRLIGTRTSRWRQDEVRAWLDARPLSTIRTPNPKAAARGDAESDVAP